MTTLRKTAARQAKRARATSRSAGKALRQRWAEAWKGLASTEAQIEKRVKTLLKKNRVSGKEVGKAVRELGNRLEKERKKATRQLEAKLGGLQKRVSKEGKAWRRAADDAVRGALATLNIPSRDEVVALTKKVDELSRKLDRADKRPDRAKARSAETATPPAL